MRILLFLVGFLIPFLAIAQPPFQKVFDNGQASSQALTATSTPDGGSAFLGIMEVVGAGSEVMVTKLSCAGDLQWVKLLGSSSTVDNVFPEIRSDQNGRIWFASNVGVYQNYDGILGVLSPDGDLLNAVRIGTPGRNDQLFGLALDTMGHVYVTGATNSWGADKFGSTSYTDVFVACLDTNLNMIWARTLGNPQNIDTGFSLELDHQNRPVITGRYIVNGTFFGFCLRMTPDGNVDLFKGFGESVVPHRTYGYGINTTTDGHILLTGSTTLNKVNHQSTGDVYLIKMDENGNPVFANIYIPTVGSDNSESGSSVVETSDGRYAIGVPTMSFSAFTQGFVPNKNAVFVTESDGQISEAKLYNTGGSHYTKIQERPGGFLFSNFSTNYGSPSFFKPLIIATDDALVSGCNEINVTSQLQLVNEGWEFTDITYNTDTSYTIQPYTISSEYAYQLVQVLCETPEDVSGVWDVPDTLCIEEPLLATGEGNDAVIKQTWDMGDGTIFTDVLEVTHMYTEGGTYDVSMRLEWNCASLDFNQQVVILPNGLTEIDTVVCLGKSYFAGGAEQTVEGIYLDTLAGIYCDSIIATSLSFFPNDVTEIDTVICLGKSYFAGGKEQTIEGTYKDTIPGELCDIIIVTNLSLMDCDCEYPLPTVITPNGDGKNDRLIFEFCGSLATYPIKLIVFNRWGKKVFESDHYDHGWAGDSDGRGLPEGSYFYVVQVQDVLIKRPLSILR